MTLLTVKEVADRLRISEPTCYRIIAAGELKSTRISDRILRVTEEALEEFIRSRTG
jgi:excisionase family DNA binding protein